MLPQPADIVERIRYGNTRADSAAEEMAGRHRRRDGQYIVSAVQPSTTASPQPLCDDVGPDDDDDVVSTDLSHLTAAQRAALIIQTGQISFDAKLSIGKLGQEWPSGQK